MKSIKLRVPREEAADLPDDLAAWARITGVDPGIAVISEPAATTDASSPILYAVYISESFFEQFPEWRMYVDQ
ncbi:hypothetical protein [Paraburkholderia sp. RL17-373-BIF-A]|jgi:hypothetical protein|uniref:hypothetical protein n=1 Tax=Paraburkholderia sp. RL17-373-BIF-A TaxID=3031629 RepID=UPI0038B856C5